VDRTVVVVSFTVAVVKLQLCFGLDNLAATRVTDLQSTSLMRSSWPLFPSRGKRDDGIQF
jgi:hypothetical protein